MFYGADRQCGGQRRSPVRTAALNGYDQLGNGELLTRLSRRFLYQLRRDFLAVGNRGGRAALLLHFQISKGLSGVFQLLNHFISLALFAAQANDHTAINIGMLRRFKEGLECVLFTFGPFFTAKVMCDGDCTSCSRNLSRCRIHALNSGNDQHIIAHAKTVFPAVTIDHNLSHCSWPPLCTAWHTHRKAHM